MQKRWGEGGVTLSADDLLTYKCCGLNGRQLLAIALHPEFRSLLKHAKQRINRTLGAGLTHLDHGIVCKNGNNHSASFAELLSYCLRYNGYVVVCCHKDMRVCGCPDQCEKVCQNNWSENKRSDLVTAWAHDGYVAFQVACRFWQMV